MPALLSSLPAKLVSRDPERDGNSSARPLRYEPDLRTAGEGPLGALGVPSPANRRGRARGVKRAGPSRHLGLWVSAAGSVLLLRGRERSGTRTSPAPALATAAVATDAAVAGAGLPRAATPGRARVGLGTAGPGCAARSEPGTGRAPGSLHRPPLLSRGLPAARACGAPRASGKVEGRDLEWAPRSHRPVQLLRVSAVGSRSPLLQHSGDV